MNYVFADGWVLHVPGSCSKEEMEAYSQMHGPCISKSKIWTLSDHLAARVLRQVNEMEGTK